MSVLRLGGAALLAAALAAPVAAAPAPTATATARGTAATAAPDDLAAREAVFAHPADAAAIKAALGGVMQELAAAQVISGPYTQKKYLRELPKPLLAGGDFLFVRDLGVAWRTVTPFASELVITREALIQREGSGSELRVSAEQQPAVRMVARIFFAVFSLDFEQLAELFRLSVLADGHGGWQLGLQPKQDAGTIEAIVVSGHADVDGVRLLEAGGDRTEIAFERPQLSTAAASAEQRARFR